jgi:hypothetical protein
MRFVFGDRSTVNASITCARIHRNDFLLAAGKKLCNAGAAFYNFLVDPVQLVIVLIIRILLDGLTDEAWPVHPWPWVLREFSCCLLTSMSHAIPAWHHWNSTNATANLAEQPRLI